jgi:hypothetical protein
MKKIINTLIAVGVLTTVSIIPANANGEATYAVVDSTGTVVNTIVCTTSVCGSGGSWNGRMPNDTSCPGCSLVFQVPANPVTGQNQGGYMGTVDNPVKYDAQAQVFTQGSASIPIPVTKTENVDTATLTATIYSNSVTFDSNSFVNGKINFNPKVLANTSATISATEGLTKEMAMFDTPKTRSQLEANINGKLLLIERYLNRFYVLLAGWLIE